MDTDDSSPKINTLLTHYLGASIPAENTSLTHYLEASIPAENNTRASHAKVLIVK